jgi:hypothetical protein
VKTVTVYLVAEAIEDEGTDWTNVLEAYLLEADAEAAVKRFRDGHDFGDDDDGEPLNWCACHGKDWSVERVELHGCTSCAPTPCAGTTHEGRL